MNFLDVVNETIEGIDVNTYAGQALVACRSKFKGIYGDNGLIGINTIVLIDMMLNHDILASQGIFITDDNREEKYIEILEKDDPKLLEALEKYISYLDQSTFVRRAIDEYKDIVLKIQELDTNDVEGINHIVKDYLNK